jgi:broad-specificity NMP kinase
VSGSSARICIAGSPKCGKTTLAARLNASSGAPVRHTDDTIDLGWSEASAEVATWMDAPGPWIIEGVAVPRALRKWMAAHRDGKPCDIVYVLTAPYEKWSRGQEVMAKGCAAVLEDIRRALEARGVEIRMGHP